MSNVTRLEITSKGLLNVGVGADIDEDRGIWTHMHDGSAFFVLTPRPEDIDIQHIAQALAKTCRFNGQTKDHKTFASIAQHSVNVSLHKPHLYPKEKLLHDGDEGYAPDMLRPLKMLMPEYALIGERLQKAIFERFHLTWPMPVEVMESDNVLLATEKRDFLAPSQYEWANLPDPLPEQLEPMSPEVSYHYFLDRFEELFGERVKRV